MTDHNDFDGQTPAFPLENPQPPSGLCEAICANIAANADAAFSHQQPTDAVFSRGEVEAFAAAVDEIVLRHFAKFKEKT